MWFRTEAVHGVMFGTTILTETDLTAVVKLDERAMECISDAFRCLSTTGAVMPPVMQIHVEAVGGQTCVKSAYVPGDDRFTVKLSSIFPNNRTKDLPNASGLMVACDARTGRPDTVLFDNGYLTAIRTAAAGAVAARYLAREDSTEAGIIGAGKQARLQLEALTKVRRIAKANVWSPMESEIPDFIREMEEKLEILVDGHANAADVVKHSDVIITTTPAREAIVSADWVGPGQHITAVGADAPGKQELDSNIIATADLYVCDSRAQCEELGEFHAALKTGQVSCGHPVTELGDIVTGKHPGRTSDRALTVCDLTGLGIQDTAIANHAIMVALQSGLGTRLE